MALTDLDFRHKFVIDNPETPPYGPMFTNFGLLATFQLGAVGTFHGVDRVSHDVQHRAVNAIRVERAHG